MNTTDGGGGTSRIVGFCRVHLIPVGGAVTVWPTGLCVAAGGGTFGREPTAVLGVSWSPFCGPLCSSFFGTHSGAFLLGELDSSQGEQRSEPTMTSASQSATAQPVQNKVSASFFLVAGFWPFS